MTAAAFAGWAVIELLGHRVRYGRVSEVTLFGQAFCRVDMPTTPPTVEFYAGSSVYGIRPASEDTIRSYHTPRPALAAGAREVLVPDDDWDDVRSDDTCGGCNGRIGQEDVMQTGPDGEVWHRRCWRPDVPDPAAPEPIEGGA